MSQKYRIKRWDTLPRLAKEWGTDLETLKAINPEVSNPELIPIGQVIRVPENATNPPPEMQ